MKKQEQRAGKHRARTARDKGGFTPERQEHLRRNTPAGPSKSLTKIAGRPLPIAKTTKPDVIWSHADFGRELEKAKKIGPKKMSNEDLLSFCHGVSDYHRAHFWVDARPFFQELWHRIEVGEIPHMNKTKACERIGCTRQWANAIVSGRADERRMVRAKAKGAKSGNQVSTVNGSAALATNEDYVDEILNEVFAKLAPLLPAYWDRYRMICEELAKQFIEASKTTPIAKVHGA
jgi:hypothetical protein